MSATGFNWPVRVYYEDTDHGGVVYYANYLKFMERARSEWLRARGIEQDVLATQAGVVFAVRSAQLDYFRPARFNQLLSVSVEIAERGKASISFRQEVRLLERTGEAERSNGIHQQGEQGSGEEVLCRGLIKVASLDVNSFRPVAIPAALRKEIFGDD